MRSFLSIAILAAAFVFPGMLRAQSYSINRYVIGGGGGLSSGASGTNTYSLTGTIGQPATASMTGGAYSLTGGFWSILSVVQTPGSPLLTITKSGNQAIISWTSSATGFVLQQNPTLSSGSWANSSATLSTNSSTVSAIVPINGGYQYFRLKNP